MTTKWLKLRENPPNLSDCHCNKDQGLKETPHNNSWVGVLIDSAMNAVPNLWRVLEITYKNPQNSTGTLDCLHVLLLMFHSSEGGAQFLDHVLKLVVGGLKQSQISTGPMGLIFTSSPPSSSLVGSLGASPMSMLNITILGVMVDIWFEKQYW